MIFFQNKSFKTLDDELYFQGHKIIKAYYMGGLVYPSTDTSIDDIIKEGGGKLSTDQLFRGSCFWNSRNPKKDDGSAYTAGSDVDSHLFFYKEGQTTRSIHTGYPDKSSFKLEGASYKLDVDNTTGDPAKNASGSGKYPVENHIVTSTSTTNPVRELPNGYVILAMGSWSGSSVKGNFFASVTWKVWDTKYTAFHSVSRGYMLSFDSWGSRGDHTGVIVAVVKFVNGEVAELIDGDNLLTFINNNRVIINDLKGSSSTTSLQNGIINSPTFNFVKVSETETPIEYIVQS